MFLKYIIKANNYIININPGIEVFINKTIHKIIINENLENE